jgi:hypothetical protein
MSDEREPVLDAASYKKDASTLSLVKRLEQLANSIERDRHEPDKMLLYVADLRRLAINETLAAETWESRHQHDATAEDETS